MTATDETGGTGIPEGQAPAGRDDPGSGEDAVIARLDMLADLFRRRLQDDRVKSRALDELSEQLRVATEGPFRQYLHPLVRGLALVIDRLDGYAGADPGFVTSVRDEMLGVLEDQGVDQTPVLGAFDPRVHEAVQMVQTGAPPGSVVQVVRRGWRHGDWVFRPAQVVVAAPDSETR